MKQFKQLHPTFHILLENIFIIFFFIWISKIICVAYYKLICSICNTKLNSLYILIYNVLDSFLGFIDLPLNDQMKLLQVTWAELLTLQVAYRSIPFNGKLLFAKDFWLDERSAKECGANDLFNHVNNNITRYI